MEVVLLGPVGVRVAGRALDVGAPRQQAVLAALAVDAGAPVPIETLIDRIWDDQPPAGARNVIYSHLSRIRGLLAGTPATLVRRHAGYQLEVDPDRVDAHRFRRLVAAGRGPSGTDDERSGLLSDALALWQAEPLAGLGGRWPAQVRDGWHQQRLIAVQHWAQVELQLGRTDRVIGALGELIAAYPLVEPLEALLIRALRAAGRTAEALERFAMARQRIADALGVEPGIEIRRLHESLLRDDDPAPPVAGPAQLPPDVVAFAGRDEDLARLDRMMADGAGAAVVICAVDGIAGIGKTALAVHWAHRVAGRFDGQLYVNLRGFDPSSPPVTPDQALRGFLAALGVPPERVPASLDAQSGLYRSLLAGRSILVVLDNARDAEQVRALLPGAGGCLAVVTSRNHLTGLVLEGARPLTLDVLSDAGARQLLRLRLGAQRVAAEPAAVDAILAACGGLPLALGVVAARAARHPTFRLAAMADEVRQLTGLDAFSSTDAASDVRAVFSWSYRQLSRPAARMFRLLGRHPGPDVTVPAAASMAGATPAGARRLLSELADAHLVGEHTPGRYGSHDLLRAYAAELAATHDPVDPHPVRRLYDYYLHSAYAVARMLNPQRDPIRLDQPLPGIEPASVADHDGASAWFAAETAVLLAAIDRAEDLGCDTYTWPLAWTLQDYLDRRGRWDDQITAQRAALRAARRLADRRAQAFANRALAGALTALGRHGDAHAHYDQAIALFEELGDLTGQANTYLNLGRLLDDQGDPAAALGQAERALRAYRGAGHRAGEANALNAMGWCQSRLGAHRDAVASCEQALAVQVELGERWGQAYTQDSLGSAHHRLGEHDLAVECYRRAAALHRELDNRYYEACALGSLGDVFTSMGRTAEAGEVWRRALTLLDDLGHPDAGTVRGKLTAVTAG